jgi:hypothetical protein
MFTARVQCGASLQIPAAREIGLHALAVLMVAESGELFKREERHRSSQGSIFANTTVVFG